MKDMDVDSRWERTEADEGHQEAIASPDWRDGRVNRDWTDDEPRPLRSVRPVMTSYLNETTERPVTGRGLTLSRGRGRLSLSEPASGKVFSDFSDQQHYPCIISVPHACDRQSHLLLPYRIYLDEVKLVNGK